MTPARFDQTLRELEETRPFQFYVVELNDGQRIKIDQPRSVAFRDGVAVFLGPFGRIKFFHYQNVTRVIVSPTTSI